MSKHIVIIQGHPDSRRDHYLHALANAYAKSAEEAGHEINLIDVTTLDFPLLRSKEDFERGTPPEVIQQAQKTIAWADHLVIFYPLWLGSMPALLKGFLEQVFRPVFVTGEAAAGTEWKTRLLKGKTARIVVTMGMPAFIYRWFYGAHSLKSLERNILGFCGIGPIKESLIGMVEAPDNNRREKWIERLRTLGREGR